MYVSCFLFLCNMHLSHLPTRKHNCIHKYCSNLSLSPIIITNSYTNTSTFANLFLSPLKNRILLQRSCLHASHLNRISPFALQRFPIRCTLHSHLLSLLPTFILFFGLVPIYRNLFKIRHPHLFQNSLHCYYFIPVSFQSIVSFVLPLSPHSVSKIPVNQTVFDPRNR